LGGHLRAVNRLPLRAALALAVVGVGCGTQQSGTQQSQQRETQQSGRRSYSSESHRSSLSEPLPAHQVGVASWYGPGFYGHRTATGEVYQGSGMTAASTTLPLGSKAIVTNLDNGRSVMVRVNDCGPYVGGRSIDLSHRAAQRLGVTRPGTAPVAIHVVDVPPGARRCSNRVHFANRTYHHRRTRVARPSGQP
jgi:rare lipoprotein A (peptidoglycan hydrolase)